MYKTKYSRNSHPALNSKFLWPVLWCWVELSPVMLAPCKCWFQSERLPVPSSSLLKGCGKAAAHAKCLDPCYTRTRTRQSSQFMGLAWSGPGLAIVAFKRVHSRWTISVSPHLCLSNKSVLEHKDLITM